MKTVLRQPQAADLILNDVCTDANGTPQNTHTIAPLNKRAGSWHCFGGSALAGVIESNKLVHLSAVNQFYHADINLKTPNVRLRADCTTPINSGAYRYVSLVLRYVDATHHWWIIYGRYNASPALQIMEVDASYLTRASVAISGYVDGDPVTLEAQALGDMITARATGGYQISFQKSTFASAAKHGLKNSTGGVVNATDPTYDNIMAWAL